MTKIKDDSDGERGEKDDDGVDDGGEYDSPSAVGGSAAANAANGNTNVNILSEEDREILAEVGGEILRRMDESPFFVGSRGATKRSIPTFEKSELGFGRILGVGSFCCAHEIIAIALRSKNNEKSRKTTTSKTTTKRTMGFGSEQPRPAVAFVDGGVEKEKEQEEVDEDLFLDDANYFDDATPERARAFMETNHIRGSDARYAVKRLKPPSLPSSWSSSSSSLDNEKEERLKGVLDLAMECKFLSVLSHPNIVKMRGKAEGDPLREDFFIVLDRLYDTLEDRMGKWNGRLDDICSGCRSRRRHRRRRLPSSSSYVGRIGCLQYLGGSRGMWQSKTTKRKKREERSLLLERIVVAYDISSVFRYLHNHKLIYRDIKPDNIGFDVRDDVKVFDFGLCKELSDSDRADDEGNRDGKYNLSGLTGCVDYMAPEVALCRPYNLSADVYSFGMLLWQIMSLAPHPFVGMGGDDDDVVEEGGSAHFRRPPDDLIIERVAGIEGYRPDIDAAWPIEVRELISECWSHDPRRRPTFQRIASLLKATMMVEMSLSSSLSALSSQSLGVGFLGAIDESGGKDGRCAERAKLMNRTEHMKERSQHSLRGMVMSKRGF